MLQLVVRRKASPAQLKQLRSVWFGARELYHLRPLLGLVADEFAELGG
jgi:hypothetical protein